MPAKRKRPPWRPWFLSPTEANSVDASDVYLAVITVQELKIGVLLAERQNPPQGAVFRVWLNLQVLPAFADRILSVDTVVVQRSARLHVPAPLGLFATDPLQPRRWRMA